MDGSGKSNSAFITSYERDKETDLDFAQARMYASKLGRFTGVDLGPFTLADPQNWNRYIYTLNNPLKFTDPSGNEVYLNGDAADDFLDFLAKKSGYELERDAKTGKVSIKKGSKRNENGTSKKFANLLKNALGKGFNLNYNVKNGDSGGVFFDNGENAKVDKSKKTVDAIIDFEDIKITDNLASELATTLTAHFLFEHVEMAKNGKPYTGDITNGLRGRDAGAHVGALIFEASVLSDLTGSNDKIREASPKDMNVGGKARYEFYYDSVQYDVYLKSTSTNGATVDRIEKKAASVIPTFEGKRP